MARPLRIEYEGAWYHVMNRGLDRQPLFLTDEHHALFLALLEEISHRYRVEIHAYCLMSNHYHLLVRTPLSNLSRAMRHLNGIYTQRFNTLQKRDGPLFRGRFKSILVEKDSYLLRLSRYIHLNPVAAKLVEKAEDFKWSSYKYYLKKTGCPAWLYQDDTFEYFGEHLQRKKYQAFIEEGVDKELDDYYKKIKRHPILGGDVFTKTVSEKYVTENHKVIEIPEHKKIMQLPSLEKISNIVCKYYDVEVQSIFAVVRRRGNEPRAVVMYLAQSLGQYKLKDIAHYLTGISAAGVSQMRRNVSARMMNDKRLSKHIKKITEQLFKIKVNV